MSMTMLWLRLASRHDGNMRELVCLHVRLIILGNDGVVGAAEGLQMLSRNPPFGLTLQAMAEILS